MQAVNIRLSNNLFNNGNSESSNSCKIWRSLESNRTVSARALLFSNLFQREPIAPVTFPSIVVLRKEMGAFFLNQLFLAQNVTMRLIILSFGIYFLLLMRTVNRAASRFHEHIFIHIDKRS